MKEVTIGLNSETDRVETAARSGALNRRSFIKWSAAVGGTMAVTGGFAACTPGEPENEAIAGSTEIVFEEGEWKPAPCNHSCGRAVFARR